MDKPCVVSVIIPVYNQEKYLCKCLDSILCQTYRELEIIIVNDASTDASLQIIKEYLLLDNRIRLISHDVNKGLFQARLTGIAAATGKYIASVDSDDYISVDWFRKLVQQAEKTKSDIVVGEWCYDNNGERCDYINLDHFRIKDYFLEGEQVQREFMGTSGRNFSWTIVVNKLYTRELWKLCEPKLQGFSDNHGKMLSWEDIAFSFALFMHAKRVTNVHGINYYYVKRPGSITSLSDNLEKNLKYIFDSSDAIKFGKQMMESAGLYAKYEAEYLHWKRYGMSILYKELVIGLHEDKYEERILTAFGCKREDFTNEASIFHSIATSLGNEFDRLETIKKAIASHQTKYVSFDVFDTLVKRPFYYPADLFELLSEKLNQSLSAYVNFKAIREQSERMVRHNLYLQRSSREDITLDEIYEYIKENYCFDPEMVDRLKTYEIELELQFCTSRGIGKELYELARDAGKHIIILSDMYLPRDVISKMLDKNGYVDHEKLYISGEVGVTKAQKTLYRYVQKDLGEKKAEVFIHIGDNYQSDIKNAKASGWNVGHLPKAIDLLQNGEWNHYTGEAFNRVYRSVCSKEDYLIPFDQYASVRGMAALIANKFFDNPFISIRPDTDYNADPRFVGYATLGPHLLALCKWIYGIAKREKIGTVHFVARDGYLVKKAFDACGFPDVKSNYIRLSRKALMLADVNCKEDLYSLFNKVQYLTTPKKLAQYLEPIIPESVRDSLETLFAQNGMPFDTKFKEIVQFYQCMKIYIDQVVDMTMLHDHKAKLKNYFSDIIAPGDYLFDIGYSGRPEAALSNLLGFPVGSLYIHTNSDVADIRLSRYNCPSEVFYQFKPVITGLMREHSLMELGPSTIGYREDGGSLVPVLEDYEGDYQSDYMTKVMQENALLFVKDYLGCFGNYSQMLMFQNETMSALWEDYLHFSKAVDRLMFASLEFEDDVGEQPNISILDSWNTANSRMNVINSTGISRTERYIRLLLKGIQSLRKDGVRVTWHKTKKKLEKLRIFK